MNIDHVIRRTAWFPWGSDGACLSWRLAGVEASITRGLPLFIEWTPPARGGLPDAATGNGATLERLDLGGHVDVLTGWLGQEVPGLTLVGGESGIRGVVISTATGPVTFPSGSERRLVVGARS